MKIVPTGSVLKYRTQPTPTPPPPFPKGAETVAMYPSLLRIFALHHRSKSADLKPYQNQFLESFVRP